MAAHDSVPDSVINQEIWWNERKLDTSNIFAGSEAQLGLGK